MVSSSKVLHWPVVLRILEEYTVYVNAVCMFIVSVLLTVVTKDKRLATWKIFSSVQELIF